ncbi:hypothetical protein CRP01_18175 [Flavilitoribacter nigricans DSM 23189 = NBRC 102662]|uniref:Uncharacterized protein n=1 Tax=Flavilitoribacter nigricans (strain ATCC 23147 / DSM 23189 / NBRC 102662 / NCIMB 1420 / SS-2) TaxID=1122177 RepID=A0A2D0N998_FLAN2|nr:hypothetical protein CRP01_18175 [Flavilitoribacter nigricans DSM 23189 = NBRC 102662]
MDRFELKALHTREVEELDVPKMWIGTMKGIHLSFKDGYLGCGRAEKLGTYIASACMAGAKVLVNRWL